MAQDRRSPSRLAALLPAGALGMSVSLASVDAAAALSSGESKAQQPGDVAKRLQTIRGSVSDALEQYGRDGQPFVAVDPETQLAWWGNGWHGGWGWRGWGWHGGWGNGGWHNGGWGNGGWHNGGWGNWHNGWHNW
jgi:rSAM-associated Gly-rich repeat protein